MSARLTWSGWIVLPETAAFHPVAVRRQDIVSISIEEVSDSDDDEDPSMFTRMRIDVRDGDTLYTDQEYYSHVLELLTETVEGAH